MNPFKNKIYVQAKIFQQTITNNKWIETANYYDNNVILNLDMTFDDRMFFGKQNYWFLNYLLTINQCRIDFDAADNKVAIVGPAINLKKFCQSFYHHSTFAIQFRFQIYNSKQFEEFLSEFEILKKEYENKCIYISYFRENSDFVLFKFLSFRKCFSLNFSTNFFAIENAINTLKEKLEYLRLGKNEEKITGTLQIPANRRESNGINIESIEKETGTQIKTIRYNDCPKYPFENVIITGDDLKSVVAARRKISAGFNYELQFRVPIKNVDLLVKNISKLNRNNVNIKIHQLDLSDTKIISFKCLENEMEKLFNLYEELLKSIDEINFF